MSLLSFSLFTSKAHLPLLGALLSASLRLPTLVSVLANFFRIKKQIWEENFNTFLSSLYRITDLTMRVVIFRSMCHPSRGLEKKNRSTLLMPRSVRGKSNVYSYERHYVTSFKYQLIIN